MLVGRPWRLVDDAVWSKRERRKGRRGRKGCRIVVVGPDLCLWLPPPCHGSSWVGRLWCVGGGMREEVGGEVSRLKLGVPHSLGLERAPRPLVQGSSSFVPRGPGPGTKWPRARLVSLYLCVGAVSLWVSLWRAQLASASVPLCTCCLGSCEQHLAAFGSFLHPPACTCGPAPPPPSPCPSERAQGAPGRGGVWPGVSFWARQDKPTRRPRPPPIRSIPTSTWLQPCPGPRPTAHPRNQTASAVAAMGVTTTPGRVLGARGAVSCRALVLPRPSFLFLALTHTSPSTGNHADQGH